MQTKYTYKEIWLIAYPILISLLMEQMIGMTDTAFLGRVGEIELGASAIAGIFYIVMFMVAFGFSIGAQILIARRNGEQQYKEIGNLFYQGVYFQLGMAAVMFALCYSFAPVILKRLVSSQHIYDAAMSYLNWRVFGFFFSFTAVMFRAFFLGTTQTKTLTLNSIVMVLSNVVFNYILIFGKFGVPQLGIAGAAIGSSLAELVSLIFFILYTRHRIDIRKYGLDKIPGIRWNILKRMLNVSFWTDGTEFPVTLHVVPALPLRRASGRTFAGRYQHHPQRIGHNVHGYDGIRFNLRIACQQPYRSRTHRLRARYDTAAYPHSLCVRVAACRILCAVPQADTERVHGYAGTARGSRSLALGTLLRLSVPRTRQRLFPVRIGNRKHAYCPGPGDDNTGGLYLLHHIHRSLSETGRGICMDIGNCLFRRNPGTLLFLHEEREMESEENLN